MPITDVTIYPILEDADATRPIGAVRFVTQIPAHGRWRLEPMFIVSAAIEQRAENVLKAFALVSDPAQPPSASVDERFDDLVSALVDAAHECGAWDKHSSEEKYSAVFDRLVGCRTALAYAITLALQRRQAEEFDAARTFDQAFAEHRLTPAERSALVRHLASIRAEKTIKALDP